MDFVLWIYGFYFWLCLFVDFVVWIYGFCYFVLWNFALWIYGCCFWFCFVIVDYFVDFVLWIYGFCVMSVGLWSLWIFVWCCNSGDGFAPQWSGPAVEALVGEGGDRSEEAEAFAVVRRWSGAASVSHRRWANIGRLDFDHVSRWKWRILTESLSRMAGDFGMTMSHDIVFWNGEVSDIVFWNDEVKNLTSSFAPSGLERHGVEPLSHKSLNARELENKPAVGWTHVCMCMLSLTMFACALSLLMFCLSCFVAHCFSLVSHVVTWIWQLRFDGFFVFLNFKRSDASGRLHGKKGCCACLCMSFRFWILVSVHVCACRLRVCACPCLKVVAPVMNVFGKGFGFQWHPQVCTLINAL